MRRILLAVVSLSVALAGLLGAGVPSSNAGGTPPAFVIMTYNIKNQDGDWPQRAGGVYNIINTLSPDIMALQELTNLSMSGINTSYSASYARYPDADGSAVAVFYNRGRYVLDPNAGVTDKVQFAAPPQAGCTRGNYVKAGLWDNQASPPRPYLVITAHLAAGNCLETRTEQVKQLRAAVAARPAGWTPIVLGDLNNKTPACSNATTGKPIALLGDPGASYNLNPTVPMSAPCGYGQATFNNGWNTSNTDDDARWDYIFANNNLVVQAENINKSKWTYGGTTKSPSDHYAVWALLSP